MSKPPSGPWAESYISGNRNYRYCTTYQRQNTPGKGWSAPDTRWEVVNASGGLKSRTGYRLANYRQLVRDGALLPTTPATCRVDKTRFVRAGTAYAELDNPSFPGQVLAREWLSNVNGQPDMMGWGALSACPEDLYRKAYVDFVSDYNSRVTEFGAFLAEAKETVEWLSHKVSSLETELIAHMQRTEKQARHLSRRLKLMHTPRKRFLRKMMDFFADTWLEYSFAVKPTIGDVQSIAEALSAIRNRAELHRVHCRGRGSLQTKSADSFSYPFGASGLPSVYFNGSQERNHKWVVRIGGTLTSDVVQPTPMQIAGVDFESILPSLWEAVPYSWLVDYLIHVGDHLTIWSNALNISVRNPWMVTVEETRNVQTARPQVTGWTRVVGTPFVVENTRFYFTRGTWSPTSVPGLRIDGLPSIARLANVAAVSIGLAGGNTNARIRSILG